jgi:predicted CXXCH cytochrome family protein
MTSTKRIKIGILSIFSIIVTSWFCWGSYSAARIEATTDEIPVPASFPAKDDDGYIGSESCKECHEDQFNNFKPTKHSRLAEVPAWKDKVVGCESCHGPGKAHLEDAYDLTKIISFKGKNSKQISETCLACHAGRESHNNFKRGEHWRNDVGCTECHSPHGAAYGDHNTGSASFVGKTTHQNPGIANVAMLRQSEPQLCMSCHTETKAQFSKPFHHKVMEGAMKCSSCHNAHGGFELKQTKLSLGADTSCVQCHSNKQGPFAFEHAPLKTEGCSACHTPHGSSNPKMLNRSSVRQLCLECHSTITEQLAPGVPSFHNQTTVRYKDCTVCHAAIHGSNSSKTFFR